MILIARVINILTDKPRPIRAKKRITVITEERVIIGIYKWYGAVSKLYYIIRALIPLETRV